LIVTVAHTRKLTEPLILAVLAVAAAGFWAFFVLASEMLEGETDAVDKLLLHLLREPGDASRAIGPEWLMVAARDVTAMGDFAILTIVLLAVVTFLLLARQVRMALFVLASVISGRILAAILKNLFERDRPALIPPAIDAHDLYVATSSFPSGHAMMAAVVYLTLGALLARLARDLRLKVYVLGVALTVVLLVGVSRIYLGVHWPSDVAAGWAIGAAWALGWWVAAQLVSGRIDAKS
jgi:undecaprenyl-diphosphatase